MRIPWTPGEEADLLVTLPQGALLRHEYYDSFVSRNPGLNSRRTLGSWRKKAEALRAEWLPSELEEKYSEEVWLEKRDIILRDNQRLREENKQLRATNELIIEAMESAITRLPAFKPPKPHVSGKGKRRPHVAMLDISDVHGGQFTRPEDVAGVVKGYNFEICKLQMDMLRESVLSISSIQQTGGIPLPKLVVNFLGDIVTNEDIYVGQGRDIDRILVDQIFQLASELSRKVLYPFCQYFPSVTANAVWGNHGRIGRRDIYHKRTNADYILYHAIRLMMDHVEHFDMRISLSSFMGYVLPEDPKRPHLIAHGDKVQRWMSIPWYGMERWEARMVGLTQVPWAFTHLGHHHQAATIDGPHGERIINGAWTGASEFSVDTLQTASQPKQKFFGLHPEWGKTFSYDIYLSKERPRLELGENGLYTPIWKENEETELR